MSVYRTLVDTVRVYIPTYVLFLTPWGRVVLEKLTAARLLKKFSAFYVTRSFIIVFTTTRHWSLS
jgi:hypothetical protein